MANSADCPENLSSRSVNEMLGLEVGERGNTEFTWSFNLVVKDVLLDRQFIEFLKCVSWARIIKIISKLLINFHYVVFSIQDVVVTGIGFEFVDPFSDLPVRTWISSRQLENNLIHQLPISLSIFLIFFFDKFQSSTILLISA